MKRACLFLTTVILACTIPAQAGLITSVELYAYEWIITDEAGWTEELLWCIDSGSWRAACGQTGIGLAEAHASYGAVSADVGLEWFGSSGEADAEFLDSLTVWIYGGSGILKYYFGACIDEGRSWVWIRGAPAQPSLEPGCGDYVGSIPFTSGVPFQFGMGVAAEACLDVGCQGGGPYMSAEGWLYSFEILDSAGRPLRAARLRAASGMDYPVMGAIQDIPEPAEGLLVACALAAMVGSRVKRRRAPGG